MGTLSDRFVLRNFPLPTRVVIAAFLISVGVGYLSALVQLHFQQSSPGQLLPGSQEVRDNYASEKPAVGQLERLILADENKPFNGSGSMRRAFTVRSLDWKSGLRDLTKDKKLAPEDAEKELRKARNLEIVAVTDWIHAGHHKETYKEHPLSKEVASQFPAEPDTTFFTKGENGKLTANVSQIIEDRCARCHPNGSGAASHIRLDSWEGVEDYVTPEKNGSGTSLTKLAQSTHVHLLGFSMLYGLTGILLSLTSYPIWFRLAFAPLALVAQLADISCWWLARYDPVFADTIRVTGGIVGLGLLIQISATLVDLFDRKGRLVLAALVLVGLGIGGATWVRVIDPYLKGETEKAVPAHSTE
jgi:hypothetical protein